MGSYKSEQDYIEQVCSKCINKKGKDMCEIHRTINGTYRCPNAEILDLTDKEVGKVLLQLGFNVSSQGFKYWQDAVLIYKKQKNKPFNITSVYNKLAEKYDVSVCSVVRCMNTASLPARDRITNEGYKKSITNYGIMQIVDMYI